MSNSGTESARGCCYTGSDPTWANAYLWPALLRIVERRRWVQKRAFDLGCGNGATANMLSELGFNVAGVDPSESGIAVARDAFPHLDLAVGSTYDDLAGRYGRFPLVVSLEVVEHCYDPRTFARTLMDLIEPGGIGVVSTPYHGYLKNLAIAMAGKWDHHFTALWDGGHIKFFFIDTLGALFREAGAEKLSFVRVGRVPPLAKSLMAVVEK